MIRSATRAALSRDLLSGFPTTLLAGLLVSFYATTAAAQIPSGYYDGLDFTNAGTLQAGLHEIIDDHVKFPLTSFSTDTWDILELAQEDPANSGNIVDVYMNASYVKQGGGNAFYEREHLWPNSYGFPSDDPSNYPFTDTHALFLCNGDYNAQRSNKPFRTCDPSCTELATAAGGTGTYPGTSNWTTGGFTQGTWEAWIGKRGDVARAMFYMDVRYDGGNHGSTGAAEPDLILTNAESLIDASNTGSNESVAYMGMLSVLLQWHAEDPVDADEEARNEVIFSFQGNRNPFIDHPEWVDLVFGNPGAPAGAPWMNELHYDNAGTDVGEFVEVAGPAGTSLTGYQLVAYNGNGGTEYGSVTLSGVLPDQGGCIGTLAFAFAGLQNGAPDGIALVDSGGNVLQFLSYEGAFTATDGPAFGLSSTDIGVAESSATAVGQSLQAVGTGTQASDFAWQSAAAESPGLVNAGQTFADACGDGIPPANPTGLVADACGPEVDLVWSPNGEPDLAGYGVYRATASGGPYAKLTPAPLPMPAYTDSAVDSGTTYYYVITAEDDEGNESTFSAEDSATPLGGATAAGAPWINELHYDNAGADAGEFVEVAGPAGLDLGGWKLIAYNGSGGAAYITQFLSGTLPDQGGCIGTASFALVGLQNGAPDGVALVDPADDVVEFLSYEGVFAASDGPAAGQFSVDIGVAESSGTPAGWSLQRGGIGSAPGDFAWQAAQADTPGAENAGQTFAGGCDTSVVAYGCGLNPAGSLVVVSGAPNLGATITLGIDNPLGTQAVGSVPVLVLGIAPDPAFPCGLPLPGFGMTAPGSTGELLIDFFAPNVVLVGPPWAGAGSPAPVGLTLPSNCNLLGQSLFAQGALVDPITSLGIGIGLTEGLELIYQP